MLLPQVTNTLNQDVPVAVQRENVSAGDVYYNRANADERVQEEGTNNKNEALAAEKI